FSNFGQQSVDLCALGEEVTSTYPGNRYHKNQGTAMATPYVTNAVTLLWSAFPHLTAAEVKAQLMESVDKIPALEGKNATGGRLNLRRAISTVKIPEATQPIATLTPTQGVAPIEVIADASLSLGKITHYEWIASDGQVNSGQTVTFQFDTPETYVITLTVTDEKGISASTQNAVVVTENQPPTALLSISPLQGITPLAVTVDASQSFDVDRTGITYQWQASEGLVSSEPKTTLTFETPGTHLITLTVTDSHGATDTTEQTITVKSPVPGIAISPTSHDFSEAPKQPKPKIPNDPNFDELWALDNRKKPGADIGATKAWGITTGQPIVCAVIDSGVDGNHPDLKDNMVPGRNFLDNNDDNADTSDKCGHGTQVAGIIAAAGNNGIGIAGVNWSAKIMPLVVAEYKLKRNSHYPECRASDDAIIAALKYAQEQGVKCINISLSAASSYNPKLVDTIKANNEALIIVAAGNDYGEDNDLIPYYPASYELDNILSVCATDHNDKLAPFSNVGRKSVDLCAPGSGILSTYIDNQYDENYGTSLSAAYVSGAATLLWSVFPNLSAMEIKNHLLASADYLPQLQYDQLSVGRLNVYQALLSVQ
ncbi:MAG: S8 family serine peptidase, partial [Candidatus Parabeggiatoa sp.]|nr:S8 family serine peptidase [Candidatus Parabeggiatoa sp.]